MVAVQDHGGKRSLRLYRWGLLPGWSRDPKVAWKLINARAETLDTKPAFREAFQRHRCIIPASGFYEWETMPDGRKVPHLFTLADDEPMGLAGLWEKWTGPEGDPVWSTTIVTVSANGLVGSFHDRMPAVLDPADYAAWLDQATPPDRLKELLRPFPEAGMVERAADPSINSVDFEPGMEENL